MNDSMQLCPECGHSVQLNFKDPNFDWRCKWCDAEILEVAERAYEETEEQLEPEKELD
jgi:tRNA(Ile2) C34 agmatinyltransferase TiaS